MISKIEIKNEVNDLYTNAVEYLGLSTDSKPTNANNGSVFLEMDTGNVFMYDAANGEWLNLSGASASESNDSEES